jgi:S1-C subfamily serine protease
MPTQRRAHHSPEPEKARNGLTIRTRSQATETEMRGGSSKPVEPDNKETESGVLRIGMLPDKLTAKDINLSSADFKILLKKQNWLEAYKISLPYDNESLRPVVDATLVFAQEEAGTAVCISGSGLLLTCSHCIAETEDYLDLEKRHCLLFASGLVVRAQCIAWDAKQDLALLRILEAQHHTSSPFPHITIADTTPKLREPLICIGHPGSDDLETSIPGIKTNYDTLHVSTGVFRGHAKGQDLQDNSEIGALKHDCWTYWGHSGAPLVSRKSGELVGLHSSWDETTGMRRGIALEAIREFTEEHGVTKA